MALNPTGAAPETKVVASGGYGTVTLLATWILTDHVFTALPPDLKNMLPGLAAVISGSCSQATNGQVAHWVESGRAVVRIDPFDIARGTDVAAGALRQAAPLLASAPVRFYPTGAPAAGEAAAGRAGAGGGSGGRGAGGGGGGAAGGCGRRHPAGRRPEAPGAPGALRPPRSAPWAAGRARGDRPPPPPGGGGGPGT